MYRILVTSDSHGDYEYICDAIDNIIDIDLIVHLGDHAADIREVMKKYPDYEFRSVRGNCDAWDVTVEEDIIEIDGFKIFICHGHRFGVKTGLDRLVSHALDIGADAALFGHTHQPFCERVDGVLLLNPGCGERYGKPGSIGIIEIEDNEIKGCVL